MREVLWHFKMWEGEVERERTRVRKYGWKYLLRKSNIGLSCEARRAKKDVPCSDITFALLRTRLRQGRQLSSFRTRLRPAGNYPAFASSCAKASDDKKATAGRQLSTHQLSTLQLFNNTISWIDLSTSARILAYAQDDSLWGISTFQPSSLRTRLPAFAELRPGTAAGRQPSTFNLQLSTIDLFDPSTIFILSKRYSFQP